jgi:hypothetical protein
MAYDYNAKIFDDGAMASTNTIYSERFSLKQGSLFSLHLEWTEDSASLTGTFTIWESNKPDPDPDSVTDWVQNTDITFTAVSGAGSEFINVGNAAARFYMVRYVNATGAGTLQCWINAGGA